MRVRQAAKEAQTIGLLAGRTKSEIPRQSTRKFQTAALLAGKMNLTNSTMGHHLARNVYSIIFSQKALRNGLRFFQKA